ncbi:MAG: hypothetical protein M0P75_00120 [Candidatus Marinimicrobia bacterium]|nr:hypothetical protein [Candidatus Neomarinimicrobiota bacterium]
MPHTKLLLQLKKGDRIIFHVQGHPEEVIGEIELRRDTPLEYVFLFFSFMPQIAIVRQSAKKKFRNNIQGERK